MPSTQRQDSTPARSIASRRFRPSIRTQSSPPASQTVTGVLSPFALTTPRPTSWGRHRRRDGLCICRATPSRATSVGGFTKQAGANLRLCAVPDSADLPARDLFGALPVALVAVVGNRLRTSQEVREIIFTLQRDSPSVDAPLHLRAFQTEGSKDVRPSQGMSNLFIH
jgi:hypothetical protein